MQTADPIFNEILQHSFLIFWKEDLKKWVIECSLLNITIEADSYKDALDKLTLRLLSHKFPDDFFELIEKTRKECFAE